MSAYRQTKKYLAQNKPDIVHTHLIHGDFYGIRAARSTGCRSIISTKHNDDPFRKNTVIRMLERKMAASCFRITAVSDWLRDFVIHMGIPSEKVVTVRNGIPLHSTAAEPSQELRDALGLAEDDTVFLCAARLIMQKGHAFLVEAFKKLSHKHKNVKLLIAGTGELEQNLKHQAEGCGQISFLGYREDIEEVMHVSDIFVLPSLWEGFGIAFLEAMQAGLPVIASDVSAVPEIVTDNETGFLVPAGQVDALYEKMEMLAENSELRDRMGAKGKERVQKDFSLEKMVNEFETVYAQALKEAE
jgi:glycosyltransferase involved in cell wall biosynthesis